MDLKVVAFLISTFCLVVNGETPHCTSTSTVGTHFIIAIPGSSSLPDKVVLHITSQNTTYVNVRVPDIRFHEQYRLTTNYINVNLTKSTIHASTLATGIVMHKGIEVKSDHPCSVTVLTHSSNDYTEGYLAYPVNVLSTNYVASSYAPFHNTYSEILIAGIYNQTSITIKKKRSSSYYYTETKSLNELDTYMSKSNYDLSGSEISSDKPIAVFGASGLSYIPSSNGDFQYLVEQMVPVKFWANAYIVPPIYPRESYMYRIYTTENNTKIRESVGNITDSIMVHEPYFKTKVASKTAVLIADKPISVIEYGYDSDRMAGDPYMTTVQAVSQFQSTYEFVTDFDYMGSSKWDVSVAITVPTAEIHNILLDGSNAHIRMKGITIPVPKPFDVYSIVYINITHLGYGQFHTLNHTLGKPFGATLYSLPGSAAAYGYPLKFALKDKVCQALPETMSTTTSTTTTVATTTTILTTTTSSATMAPSSVAPSNNTVKGGIQCFDCRDIPHLKYCDRVTTCMQNEVCYVESYTKPHGTKMYRSGCIDKEKCMPVKGQDDCLQCCDASDFCNMIGCEEEATQGSLGAGTRGPYCYDCSHLGENEQCHSVQLCPSDEVCMVEKYVWGDSDYNYVMGCIRPHVCEAKRKRTIEVLNLTRRHAPACTQCCTTDFCNLNCTTHHHSPEIVG